MGTPAWNKLKQSGPPEDWLRRVREGAPGLLVSVEEGGTPWLGTSRGVIGNDQPQREITSTSAEHVRPQQASSAFEEPRAARAPASPARPASRENGWLEHLKRQFIPAVFARRAEEEKPRRREHAAAESRAARERPVASVQARPELAGEDRPPQAPHAAIQSRHAVLPEVRPAETVALRWTSHVKQRIQAALQTTSMNRPTAMMPAKPRKAQRPSPPAAAAFPGEAETPAGQVRTEVNRAPSQPAVPFPTPERSSRPGGHDRGPSNQQWTVRDVPALTSHSGTWISLPDRAQEFLHRARESAGTGIGEEQATSRTDDLRARQLEDQRTFVSGYSPKSESVDPWPELPESQPMSTWESKQVLRNSERLRALELEQRGGR
jgi:hypothetical protein